jgi:hypothetical protein
MSDGPASASNSSSVAWLAEYLFGDGGELFSLLVIVDECRDTIGRAIFNDGDLRKAGFGTGWASK